MAQTKQEIRNAWTRENMKQYGVTIHKEHERNIIEFVEKRKKDGHSISSTFKAGIERLIADEEGK